MNLNLFKTYVKVVETQNLSKTAEDYGISQPAVTKQIQSLEDTFGVLLLERSGRKLKPTEAGEILYNYAREIIKVVEKTQRAMEELSESRKGSLFIGASTIPGQYILPYLIKIYKDKYFSTSISMDIADTEKIFNKVAERELDLGIVGGWLSNRKVDGFQWLEDELVVVVPESHKLAKSQEIKANSLVNERWIFREKGSGTRKAVESLLAAQGIRKEELNIYMEAGSTEAVLAMVESGMGISIVSRWAIKRIEHRKLKAIKLDDPNTSRALYVIYPRQKVRRKSVTNFLEYLKVLKDSSQN
ncbi:MAG: selenium metabolism-associated LysR family transcriptional regulator [Syntrophomonadaceae bacterium]|nr:selenium metabolism-associated LysR family transcriptional regulator [Syntrophomonadaceae bacterium]